MSEINYTIQTTNGNEPVTGEQLTEHLAAHEDFGTFVLDHIASGLRVVTVGTLEDARTIAESIEPLIDWSKLINESDPRNTESIPDNVREYLKSIRRYSRRVHRIGEPWPDPPNVKIRLRIEVDEELLVTDLWPDRDWPDEITEDAVRELIVRDGGAARVVDEWSLTPVVSVEVKRG